MRLPFVRKNPLTMVGSLDRCWLFAFRTSAAEARRELPTGLELVSYGDIAYWNVVVSHIDAMRPLGAPRRLGVSYWHVAYRLYARVRLLSGVEVEGLYFVRSDCDSRLMTLTGNLVTDFAFQTAGVHVQERGDQLVIVINSADAPATVEIDRAVAPRLPVGSPFASLDEAASALKYKPYGISLSRSGAIANIVRISRDERAWRSRLVHVSRHEWAFFAGRDVQPELCYEVAPIDYRWNRGRVLQAR